LSFNQAQVADEQLKIELLNETPELEPHLFDLEDHPLLRGCLASFELDPTVFETRARAFHDLFATRPDPSILPSLTGALLAAGDYSQRLKGRFLQLGSSVETSRWREEILTGSTRAYLTNVRAALGRVLDVVAERETDVRSALDAYAKDWLAARDQIKGLDWRWYFVRYREMRAGRSGIYATPTGALGYSVCMLDKKAMSSYYRDPYLTAIRVHSGVAESAVEGSVAHHWSGGPWFTGYETEARSMRLRASGAGMQCVHDGFHLRAPEDAAYAEAFSRVCDAHGIDADLRLKVPQVDVGGDRLDTTDRVELGSALLRDLVNAGL
jgi:hypothetical protein